jgi:cold shock CspA family protein
MIGRLTRIVRARGCGFIRAADGQDVFFHASELLHATLNELKVGDTVRYTLIRDSVSGPRATLVRPNAKKRITSGAPLRDS